MAISPNTYRFIKTTYKYTGSTKYNFKIKRIIKEVTFKKAESYLKKTMGAYAYVGSQNIRYDIRPTKDKKFVLEYRSSTILKIKRFKDLVSILAYIKRIIKKEKITIKISMLVSDSSDQAKKYKYNVYTN